MADDQDDISASELFDEGAAAAPEVRLHPILSNEEVLSARKRARDGIEKARIKAASKAVEEEETERLRVQEGLTTGVGVMDEVVQFTVDLPIYAPFLMVNGPTGSIYWHSRTYTIPRHVANSLAEMQARAWRHDDQLEGKSLQQQFARRRNTTINGKTGSMANAPRHFDA